MRRWFLALAATLACGLGAVPAAHAASVTLTSPAQGATFYTNGASFALVPVSATRDLSGCLNGPSTYWYVLFQGATGPTFGANGTMDTIESSVATQPGDYTVVGRFLCSLPGGGTSTIDSAVHTIHVVQGSAPPPPPGTDPELVQICQRWQAALGRMAAGNNRVRNEIIPRNKDAVEALGWLSKFGSIGSKIIAANPEIPGSPVLAGLYKVQGQFAKGAQEWGKHLTTRMEEQVRTWDDIIVTEVRQYEQSCRGITSSARLRSAAAPAASSSPRPVRAAAAPSPEALQREGRALVAAQAQAGVRLNAALRTLTGHLTADGAPARDVSAVRTQAAKAIKLLQRDIALRTGLARTPALAGLRVRAADIPPALRADPEAKRLVGKPVSTLLAPAALRALVKVLQAQPALP